MHVTSELVLVNVVARDRHGNLIRDLKKTDFTLSEDGKKQDISTFDFENVDALATAGAADATVTGAAGNAPNPACSTPRIPFRSMRAIAASSSCSSISPAWTPSKSIAA